MSDALFLLLFGLICGLVIGFVCGNAVMWRGDTDE